MSKQDVIDFLARRKEEIPANLETLTDADLTKLAIEKYQVQNPKCATERIAVKKMREGWINKMKKLQHEKKKA